MSTSNNPANQTPTTNTNLSITNNSPVTPASVVQQSLTSSSAKQSIGSRLRVVFPKFMGIFKKVIKKLVIWFIFTVAIGLLPIIASWFLGHFDHKLSDPFDLFFRGELLIIAFALAADAMGDLVNSNKLDNTVGVLLFGICFILFALFGLVFAGLGIMGSAIDKESVGTFSFYMLGATFVASMGCKILTEV